MGLERGGDTGRHASVGVGTLVGGQACVVLERGSELAALLLACRD